MIQNSASLPGDVANAVKLLWLSLMISTASFAMSLLSGFSLSAILQFAIIGGLWAFAIILIPTRNNLARLGLLLLTGYMVVGYALAVLGAISILFTINGLLGLASLAAAVLGSLLLLKSDHWFGSLTTVSL